MQSLERQENILLQNWFAKQQFLLIAVRTEIVPITTGILARQLSTNHRRKFHCITTRT